MKREMGRARGAGRMRERKERVGNQEKRLQGENSVRFCAHVTKEAWKSHALFGPPPPLLKNKSEQSMRYMTNRHETLSMRLFANKMKLHVDSRDARKRIVGI